VKAHALQVLELPRVLALVADRAASALGREAVLSRRPATDVQDVRREIVRVEQTAAFLVERPGWGPPTIPDALTPLRRLSVEGSVLEPLELHALGVLLASSRTLGEEIDRRAQRYPALDSVRALLYAERPLETEIARTVDADGAVPDGASPELKRLRESLRRAHTRIVRKLEAFVRTLPERYVVTDASVTLRGGRYVIAVRREAKGEIGGVVLDESSTGATVFLEPPLAIELMNELGALEREEAREIRRILRELTRRLEPVADALSGSQEALVDFDSLQARARTALEWRAEAPEVLEPGAPSFGIVEGRHPLLLAQADAVVPFDLSFEDGERVLVVSGPNTGGKSVFLKAMGLLPVLAQSGILPPVRKGTRLPVFTQVFADIGDEQSIEGSLSTFSAHLANLREIVHGADAHSLVLVDEMGTGTDPAEGAALARAVLEELAERGAVTIATSHLGALKHLDGDGSKVVNASLQFDPDRMEPTYKLVKGRPGRSYGLAIARRLGFPAAVLDRAEQHISTGQADMEDLLERLERQEKEARRLVEVLAREQQETARLSAELERREAELGAREKTAEKRAREEARKVLMEAREEVEEAIRQLKSADAEAVEEASRSARRRVEEAARRQREGSGAPAHERGSRQRGSTRPRRAERRAVRLEVGQRVRLTESGATGRLAEIKGARALVETSGLRIEMALADLVPVDETGGRFGAGAPDETPGRVAARGPAYVGPTPDPSAEVDLRGLRVDEVELELARALDAAILGDLTELRIIHGKGTGAVRERVRELLKSDGRVRDFRLGLVGEGGAGVTVAKVGGA
jgi:DNA mismatch repair protein MutS2